MRTRMGNRSFFFLRCNPPIGFGKPLRKVGSSLDKNRRIIFDSAEGGGKRVGIKNCNVIRDRLVQDRL